jgi:hypothetical protein
MRIIQQLPSQNGRLSTNIIEDVRYVKQGSSFLLVYTDTDEIIIKDFRSPQALFRAYMMLQENIEELHLEYDVFFEEPIYSKDAIAKAKYMKLPLHLQREAQRLIIENKFKSKDLRTLYAFETLKPRDMDCILNGIIDFEITRSVLSRWITTLSIPKLAEMDGVTKKQYYEIQYNRYNSMRLIWGV